MSITYGFYNSVNHDRKYNATQMSNLFEGIINDGVFASIGTSMVVQAGSGMVVNVGEGRAWFNKTWTNNDAAYPITISEAELTLNRIDTIVLEVNTSTRINAFKVIKGTPGTTPSAPDLTNSDTQHQHPLAQIYVGASVTEILQANITNFVGTEKCPFITGIIQTITTEGITALFEAEWDAWFTSIQNQLSGDVAGNLQLQINETVDIADKATEEEAIAGTNDTHWMSAVKTVLTFLGLKASKEEVIAKLSDSKWVSPLTFGQAIAPIIAALNNINNIEILFEQSSSGTYTVSIPDDVTLLHVVAIGGGGGGGCGGCGDPGSTSGGGGGGGGGFITLAGPFLRSTISSTSVVIGAGGSGAGQHTSPRASVAAGGTGGTTSVFGKVIAYGGPGGSARSSSTDMGVGGQGSTKGGNGESYYNATAGESGKTPLLFTLKTAAGAGGGGAGRDHPNSPGSGGIATFGAGGAGGVHASSNGIGNGNPGFPGGGGGGGGGAASTSGVYGAKGGDGGSGYVCIFIQRKDDIS